MHEDIHKIENVANAWPTVPLEPERPSAATAKNKGVNNCKK
jgi:hypothetical protein